MRTPLYDRHRALGAKIVDFSAWEMPLQYQSIIAEHNSVRHAAGLFDVSHMGRLSIVGKDSEPFLDYLSTNNIIGKKDFSATYTVLPSAQCGCVDDVIVYRLSKDHFFIIVNAGNRQNDLEHLLQQAKSFQVDIISHYNEEGILSIQGPKARTIASAIFPQASSLGHMHFCETEFHEKKVLLSCTGYTGEDGFEVYAPHAVITSLWDEWLEIGKPFGLVPVGLGARDTLRLEKGYALFGHEISDAIAPTESVSAWTVKWKKPDFLGKKALEDLEKSPLKRSEAGIILTEPGIARAGYEVFKEGVPIGTVTSGTFSPTLNKAIAIILVKGKLFPNDVVEIKIRQNFSKAVVVPLPFVK